MWDHPGFVWIIGAWLDYEYYGLTIGRDAVNGCKWWTLYPARDFSKG